MNRRDFLLFKKETTVGDGLKTVPYKNVVAELSCERLYMRTVDTRLVSAGNGPSHEECAGEPPAVFDGRTADQLFADLASDLHGVHVLRLLEPSWISLPEVKDRFDAVLVAFRAGGGRVEIEWPAEERR